MGYTWNFGQYVAGEAGIWVNTEGKRFVNENANRKVRADAILVEQGKGLKAQLPLPIKQRRLLLKVVVRDSWIRPLRITSSNSMIRGCVSCRLEDAGRYS